MAKIVPEFMQRKLARKTANITRLSDSYKSQVDALSNDYQTQFSQYQAKRAETMAPYEASVKQYQADYSGYEQAAAAYKQKLSDYTALLADIQARPLDEVAADKYKVNKLMRYGTTVYMDGKSYQVSAGIGDNNPLPEGYTFENDKLYKARSAGEAPGAAPTAPKPPEAPVVAEFDSSQFDAKKGELQNNLQRDLGAVKAAKMGAVSRRSARPMLQGVANG